jgi:phospho-N-acetylmuramoyl-pentapeptide-transferase
MIYHLLTPLAEWSIVFNVFRYVTFRAIAAFVTALCFTLFLGPHFIRMLKNMQALEQINENVPEHHRTKRGTPTMGGLFMLAGMMISVLLWNNLTNSSVLTMILTALWLGGIGFLDDYLKNFRKLKGGLVERYKLLGQVSLGLVVALILYYGSPDITSISVPFLKSVLLPLGIVFIPFVVFVIVAASNAVNLTDGLDGLAAGTIGIATLALGVMAYLKGNYGIAHYLRIEFLPEAGELTVFSAAMMGTTMGFLWYNTHPAEVFMGDTGSLTMGGLLAVLCILLREEFFFGIVGGVFVVEVGSSLIQRYYFKFTRIRTGTGKRIFLCAPLHHHFELKGWKEEKIVVRFWVIALMLTAIGLATLKLR